MCIHVGGKTYCAATAVTLLGASLAEGASGHSIGVVRGAGGGLWFLNFPIARILHKMH